MIRRDGDSLMVEGAVTIDTAPMLVSALAEHLNQGVKQVDFSQVTDVDSAAVALALEWQRQAARQNVSLAWKNIPPALHKLANLYGVAELLPAAG